VEKRLANRQAREPSLTARTPAELLLGSLIPDTKEAASF